MAELICTPMSGKGKLLADFLMEQLGIPKNVCGFDVRFEAGEAILVTVRSYARADGELGEVVDTTPVTSDVRVFTLIEHDGDC
ncbi:hypothetical protein [Paraburkholderia caledonica]|uniref:hypothetical protein n=1 Tax=Paraburkholderia caledonica TaxID=134536 RepID=UPI0038BA7A13